MSNTRIASTAAEEIHLKISVNQSDLNYSRLKITNIIDFVLFLATRLLDATIRGSWLNTEGLLS